MDCTAEEALKALRSGHHVFIHSVAAAPQVLIKAMVQRTDVGDVQIYHLHTEGEAPYADALCSGRFFVNALFIGPNTRKCVNADTGSYIPVFLSEAPQLFRRGIIKPDIALITVSPPDIHGYCSLGVSVDTSLAAVENASIVIAQVNSNMPRTHGDGIIHKDRITHMVWADEPLHEVHPAPLSDIELKIGNHVASLIEDGSTLQLGIGNIPNAVLASLMGHKDLGLHTEMFSDGIIPLAEKGIMNGRNKKVKPGKMISSFVMGSKKLYDFVHDNPFVELLDCGFVNDTYVISRNPKVVAINSAIEIDLSGQVCADSIGSYMYSGVGGQMDFIRGASLSEGGKPIIALPSSTSKGESRIVRFLKQGAGVVTTRAHMHYVVTEYGVADLYGKNLRQRARLLIEIAHPRHREELEKAYHSAR
jgi:acyl-CoA hydrolase